MNENIAPTSIVLISNRFVNSRDNRDPSANGRPMMANAKIDARSISHVGAVAPSLSSH